MSASTSQEHPLDPPLGPSTPHSPLAQVMELLAEHLSQWAAHVAAPETGHLTIVALRRFARSTPVDRFRRVC